MRGFGTVRYKNTQKIQFTCWRSAHEIILGEPSCNFGCGYAYGTRFGHNLTGPPGKLASDTMKKTKECQTCNPCVSKASAARPEGLKKHRNVKSGVGALSPNYM
jgi:hypothetical protein